MTTDLTSAVRTIRFGDFEICQDRFELCRLGKRVHIEPQALEVLTYLASHPGRLISKEELWRTLWQGRCVSDAAIAKQVREARRALGDNRRDPIWIKTVYARGAIFVGKVLPPTDRPTWLAAAPASGKPQSKSVTTQQEPIQQPATRQPVTRQASTRRAKGIAAPTFRRAGAQAALPRRTARLRAAKARVTAYDLRLRAKHLLRVGTEVSCRSALELFTKATRLHPASVQAQTGVAISCAHLWLYYATDRHQLSTGLAALERAHEQQPDLAEARHASGLFEWIRGDRLRAASTLENVLVRDAGLPECMVDFSRLCRLLDDPDRALRVLSSDTWRRSTDYRVPLFTAMGHKCCNDVARSEEFHEKGVCAARQHLEVFPQDARAWSLGGAALVHLGSHRQALGWTRTATRLARHDGLVMFNASCIATACGDREGALSTLRALRDQSFPFRSWIEVDQDLDPLRDDDRFTHILSSWPVPSQTPARPSA